MIDDKRKECTNLGEYLKTGGPGRPKGVSGRQQALSILDSIFADSNNKEILRQKLQEKFDKDPVKFFDEYDIPLLPKDTTFGFKNSEGEDLSINTIEVRLGKQVVADKPGDEEANIESSSGSRKDLG
jgi:hypothetical protein